MDQAFRKKKKTSLDEYFLFLSRIPGFNSLLEYNKKITEGKKGINKFLQQFSQPDNISHANQVGA